MSLDCESPIGAAVLAPPRVRGLRPANDFPAGEHIADSLQVVVEETIESVTKRRAPMADWLELTKPRIVTMILVTSIASACVAGAVSPNGVSLSLVQWFFLLIGTGLVAASAGAANQIWEVQIDRLMPRTARRPLPDGRIGVLVAFIGMLLAGLMGTFVLAWKFGAIPAAVGLATWVLYVLIYTPMKTRTSFNTTVGAVAGALPIFIGYTAAGGQFNELAGWMLLGILAFWQYPHFMAIAWLYRGQYGDAGFKMTTTVEPSGRSAAWQSILGSLALTGCGLALVLAPRGDLTITWHSVLAAGLIVVASWPLLRSALNFRQSPVDSVARTMMRWSLLVLPMVLLIGATYVWMAPVVQ